MTFLYPSFLWALTVLSIPIIVHLFNFRKTTKVYFSNTRFLKQIKESTTAKRKLKHYLILASRLLFLFFLIIAFCQPVIPAAEQLGSERNIVFYLDNSQSMSAQTSGKTRGLDEALGFAKSLVEVFPPDTRYKLITNDFSPFSNTYKTKPEALDLLTQIRLSPVTRTFNEVYDRIKQEGGARTREIFWISDLQKSTLGPVLSSVDSASRLQIIPVQYGLQSNVFVDSAYLDNPFSTGGGKNVLHVKIRNDGQKNVSQLNLKLMLNDVQAAITAIDIPSGGTTEATFDLTAGLSKFNELKISFNDFPVSFDNEFYVALNFAEKINVTEIRTTNSATVIEKVFGNQEIFNLTAFPVGNINYNVLGQSDLVVVNGLNTVDASLMNALRSYVNNYGTLLLVPGTRPDIESFKTLLQLPALKAVESKIPLELGKPDFSNPFFENVFEERAVSMAMPKASKVLDWGNDRTAILQFKNDQPFLSRFTQRGQIYLLSCALDPDQTDFFNHALFVPVMYRVAASGKRDDLKPYYGLHESLIKLRIDSVNGEEPLRWIGAEEIIPAQRKVNDEVIFEIPKFSMSKGFYKVVMRRDTVNLLAFNLDKAESLMEQYRGEEFKRILGGGDHVAVFQIDSEETFSNEIKERYLGKPLWKYALVMAIFFLLVEILLIRFLK
jgi:Aerotolerance regulator N-terminal